MKNKSLLLNVLLGLIIVVLVLQISNKPKHEHHQNHFREAEAHKDQPFDHQNPDSMNRPTEKNATLATIYQRKSVRHFTQQTVNQEQLKELAKAGMAAPTAMNKQPWAFVVIDNRDTLNKMAQALPYAKMLAQAPAAIVVCGDMDKAIDGEGQAFWIQDCSAASQNILLAVESMGLGAVWTGVYPDKNRVVGVQQVLGIPANKIPLNVIVIGYPTGEDQPKDKWKEENLHWNKW